MLKWVKDEYLPPLKERDYKLDLNCPSIGRGAEYHTSNLSKMLALIEQCDP